MAQECLPESYVMRTWRPYPVMAWILWGARSGYGKSKPSSVFLNKGRPAQRPAPRLQPQQRQRLRR
ncbi:Protein of unknown function [Gryllus bimaculatus]|nr:Protein of unknown function [Gryllus bimaculatus]